MHPRRRSGLSVRVRPRPLYGCAGTFGDVSPNLYVDVLVPGSMVFRGPPDLVGMSEPHAGHDELARIGECTGDGVDHAGVQHAAAHDEDCGDGHDGGMPETREGLGRRDDAQDGEGQQRK